METDQQIQDLIRALVRLDRLYVRELFEKRQDTPVYEIIDRIVVPALDQIGREWERGDLALSQVYMSSTLIQEIIGVLSDSNAITPRNAPPIGIASFEDHHILGYQIVSNLVISAGYAPILYKVQNGSGLLNLVQKDRIGILLLSSLMLPSALRIRDFISQMREKGIKTQVIVGGAPFRLDPLLYREIGADYMAASASDVLPILQEICIREGYIS
ncbi:MAG: B12-binding domain-containing protein [Methanospirillum sp.]|nr:B12-binding domain-containing protein [Methanospirillum sp.]